MNNPNDLRMIFFVRTDLGMTKGKIAAQVGHAVQYLITKQYLGIPSHEFLEWVENDAIKICLKVNSEKDLIHFFNIGLDQKFKTEIVIDKGYTQFNNVATSTVVAWGPISKDKHEVFTSHLKLL